MLLSQLNLPCDIAHAAAGGTDIRLWKPRRVVKHVRPKVSATRATTLLAVVLGLIVAVV
jgi:hypothetical protein